MGIFDKIAGFFEDIFGAIGDALSWLLGVPDADDYAGQLINKNSNVANLPVVYGRRLIGGTRVFVSTGGNNKNEYMYIVLALSEGEIQAINSVYVNDKLMVGTPVSGKPYRKVTGGDYKDIIWYQTFTGTDDQTACTTLFNDIGSGPDDFWGANHRLRGVAYIAMVVKYHQDKGMTSIPEIRCEIQGRKVYDPRTETTVWTSNPALCLRDYLTNERFGKGLPDSAIDDEAFGAAATFCDSTVSSYTGGPSINTFSLNMILDTGNTLFDNTKRFLLAMRGIMPYSQGKYSLIIDKDDASVGTIDESICTRDITIKSVNKNTKLNQVKAVFVNPYKRYEQDSVIWPPADSLEESTFLAEDNNQVLSKDLTLDTVTNFYQARELARVAVLASRSSSIICELVCTSEALKYAVGDIITLEQPSMGWVGPAAKEFRILSIQLAVSGEVGLTLQEYDSSIYPWVTGSEQDDQPETTLPNPNSVDAITTASVTTGSQVLNDGTIQYFADLTWTPPSDELIQDYVVKINKKVGSVTTENVETITTINNKARYILTDTNAQYGYSIQARNGAQVTSEPFTVAPVAVVTDTTAPAPIASGTISAVEGLEVIAISWTNPTDPDFDLVNIKVSDTTTEPTEVFAQVRSNTFVHEVNEYNKTKYYWLATVDTSGNISAYTSAGPFSTGQPDYNDLTNTPTIPTIPEVAGTFYISLSDSNAPTDTEFNTAVGRDPLENDFVIVSYPDGTGTSTKGYNYNGDPLAWTEVTEYIDGSMIVTGSLSASDITTGTLNANDVTISNLTVSYGSQVTDKPDLSVYLTDSDIENLVTLKDVQESGFAPYQTWDFQNSADGWSASGITATNNADYISLVSTTTDPTFSENGLTINGGIYDTVLVRIRRTAGDGWQGTLYYSTSQHGSSEYYRQIIPDTTVLNEWVILTYDMHNLNQGGDDWKNNTIYGLRFDWGNGTPNDAFDVDWIAVGKRGSVPISEYDIKDFITGGDVNSNVTSISGGVIQAGTAITVGTGDNVAILSGADTTYRLWAGNATASSAPFAVTQTGILSATGAIIDGNITANSLDVENATVTGTFVAPIGWSNNIYSGVINRGNLNESVKDLIDERIAEVTGGISGDFGQDDGGFSHIAQGNPDPDDPIVLNITHETGKNLTVELSGSRSWNRTFAGLPETDMGVSITLERSPAGANTWTSIATLTDSGDSITTTGPTIVHTSTYRYSISIYHVLTDDQASGNYDYRARTTIAGSAYNVTIPLQLTVVEPATVGAGNADTLDNQDGTYYLDYNNFTNTPDLSTKADLSGDTFTGDVKLDSELQFSRGSSEYSNYIRAQNYPSQGFVSSTAKYWIEYGAKGGHHFVVNTDGGSGSAENDYDDFTIWQGEVDGDKLLSVSNVGNVDITGTITASGYNSSNWDTAYSWDDHSTQGYLKSVPSEYLTQTDSDSRYQQSNGLHKRFYKNNGNTGTVWYKLGNFPNTSGFLQIIGTIGSHVESFGTSRLDLTMYAREGYSGVNVSIDGKFEVAHQGTGLQVYRKDNDGGYESYDVWLKVGNYAQVCIDLNYINFTYDGTSTTTQPDISGYFSTEIDTTTYGQGSYDVEASAVYERYNSGVFTNNSSNWDTAYTYSQVGHLPLSGGTVSGDIITTSRLRVDDETYGFTTGFYDTEAWRGQAIIDSRYSDLIIASRELNSNTHGSTLTFATQSTDTNDYAKIVLNQGQYNKGAHLLSFSYGLNQPNPHTTCGANNANAGVIMDLSGKTLNVINGYQLNGTTVIDSSRNLTNINRSDDLIIGTTSQAYWGRPKIGNYDIGWGAHPSIGSDGGSAGQLIMLANPHIPYRTDNTRVGASGRAGIRCGVNATQSSWWDIGLTGDQFEIYRSASATQLMTLNNVGDVGFSGTIQNGSIWINDGTNYNSYNENIRLFDPDNNGPSVIAFGASGVSGSPRNSILSYNLAGYGLDFRKGNTRKLSIQEDVYIDNANLYSPSFRGEGADYTPLGTTFTNAFKGDGTYRTVYFDGYNSNCSVWWGVGNNPHAALDSGDGKLEHWVNTGSTWNKIFETTTSGITVTTGSINSNTVKGNNATLGMALGGYSLTDTDEVSTSVVQFGNNRASTGWDEFLIKGSSARGVFGRTHFGIHTSSEKSFAFHASSWATNAEFCGDGRTYLKGPVGINYIPSSTSDYKLRVGGTSRFDDELTAYSKRHNFGHSANWDEVGFSKQTNVHFQGHNQFWVGAGNGTWFYGTANNKNYNGGLSNDASVAHDLLITTMQGTSTYDRGITFAVDGTGSGNSGWRLGKWHSGTGYSNSLLAIDGNVKIGGGNNNEPDYYTDDYSAYHSTGRAGWQGDSGYGWHDPSLTVSNALQIQSSSITTSTAKPQIQFHQYGYGGPKIEYDGPSDVLNFSGSSNRLDWVQFDTSGQSSGTRINFDQIYTPVRPLHIQYSSAQNVYIHGNATYVANVGIGSSSASERLHVHGNIVATGNITAYYSDMRLKDKVGDIDNALEIVSQIETLRYKTNELGKFYGFEADEEQIGVSAQSVQKVLPQVVKSAPFDVINEEVDNPNSKKISKSGKDYITVQYDRLVPVLIEAIKELKSEIEELKNGND